MTVFKQKQKERWKEWLCYIFVSNDNRIEYWYNFIKNVKPSKSDEKYFIKLLLNIIRKTMKNTKK